MKIDLNLVCLMLDQLATFMHISMFICTLNVQMDVI